jgi:hypothetical protein
VLDINEMNILEKKFNLAYTIVINHRGLLLEIKKNVIKIKKAKD